MVIEILGLGEVFSLGFFFFAHLNLKNKIIQKQTRATCTTKFGKKVSETFSESD